MYVPVESGSKRLPEAPLFPFHCVLQGVYECPRRPACGVYGRMIDERAELDRRDAMQSSHASLRIWTSVPRGPKLTTRLATSGSTSDCHHLCLTTQFHTAKFFSPGAFSSKKNARPFAATDAERRRWLARGHTPAHPEDVTAFTQCPGRPVPATPSPLDVPINSGPVSACFLEYVGDKWGRGAESRWLEASHQIDSTHKLHNAWLFIGSSWLWPCTWFNRIAVSLVRAICVHIDVYPDTTRLLPRCGLARPWAAVLWLWPQSTLVDTNAENCSYPLGTYWYCN